VAEFCSHPNGALIVPNKVIPAFQGSLLPRDESAGLDKPKTFGGKIAKFVRKTSLLTCPPLLIGSFTGLATAITTMPDASLPLVMIITVTTLGGFSTGALGTINSIASIIYGDRKYAPLPPTKEYQALQKSKADAVIKPFEDWDDMFRKNNAPVQKIISNKK
jgi:hypothetical protein